MFLRPVAAGTFLRQAVVPTILLGQLDMFVPPVGDIHPAVIASFLRREEESRQAEA